MPDTNQLDLNSEINFAKSPQDENRAKQKKMRIIQSLVVSALVLVIAGYLIYQSYDQANNNLVEVLPSSNQNQANKPNNISPALSANPDTSVGLSPITSIPGNKSTYYIGKIDGKIPFRVRLDYIAGAGNAEFEGLEAYDNVSEYTLAVIGRQISSPSPEYCPNERCAFSMQEFDPGYRPPGMNPLFQSDPVGVFDGSFDLNDKEINQITGTFTKPNTTQKLKFELTKSAEFKIEDYLKPRKQNYTPPGNYSLIGNCKSYVEPDDQNDCMLLDIKTKEIVFNFDKYKNNSIFGSNSFKRGGNLIKLGKQNSNVVNVLYYFPNADHRFSSQGLGTLGTTMTVTQFNTSNNQLSVLSKHRQYLTGICGHPDKVTSYNKKCLVESEITQDTMDEIKAHNFDYRDSQKLYDYPDANDHLRF